MRRRRCATSFGGLTNPPGKLLSLKSQRGGAHRQSRAGADERDPREGPIPNGWWLAAVASVRRGRRRKEEASARSAHRLEEPRPTYRAFAEPKLETFAQRWRGACRR